MLDTITELQAEAEQSACQGIPRPQLVPGILGRALKSLKNALPFIRHVARCQAVGKTRQQEAESLALEMQAVLDAHHPSPKGGQ